ncbi:MAG: Nucleoside diphosphate kinase [Gammaproteobacteria bacterium]|nr:MAG: Nucleoside diphosphate kinase [Gammaproteobacteria bacterium]
MAIEKTLSIIKPDAVKRNLIGNIINKIEEQDLVPIEMKMLQLSEKESSKFYEIHKEKPFFVQLVDYMTSGKIIVMILEGDNAVNKYRDLIGSTDPNKAKEGSIRKLYALNTTQNSVHASDSLENAKREIEFFFNI